MTTRSILCLLVTVIGYLPLSAEASFQDWYALLSGTWTNPSFPDAVSTTFSYKNLGCSQVNVTLDGEEVARSSNTLDDEKMWKGFPSLIKQKWVSDKQLRVTVWLISSADEIESAMAFAKRDAIRLYYSERVHKWEGPAPPIACLFTHRLTYDFPNIDRKPYKVEIALWIWELFYVKLALALALVLLCWYLYGRIRRGLHRPATPKT